jgi:hypothetical protein
MTDKELLDLALEALRSAAAELYKASSYCNTYEVLGNTNDAITAIQQARAAQPAPVQEPVGLAAAKLVFLPTDHPADKTPIEQQKAFVLGWNGALELLEKQGPIYTTPPAAQRQWVGLTDEEFEDIELGCRSTSSGKIMAMQKVEAKLKEKNNG